MPYIGFNTRRFNNELHFLLKEPFAENLQRLTEDAAKAFPDKTIDFTSMEESMRTIYNPVRVFRNATVVAGVVMFFIMLMGLLGYTTDEVQRRSKEIAIRKVNGAQALDILCLLRYSLVRLCQQPMDKRIHSPSLDVGYRLPGNRTGCTGSHHLLRTDKSMAHCQRKSGKEYQKRIK